MLMIFKAVLLLMVELISEYLFGTLVVKLLLKRDGCPGVNVLIGFVTYQAVFQLVALGFIFTTGVLHQLSIVWMIIVGVIMVISVINCRTIIVSHFTDVMNYVRRHKSIFLGVVLIVCAFCYYVSINGEINEDAKYYIGLVSTSVDTDSLFRYNVYNGYEVESLYLRRMLVTFEIQSAVLSQFFGIHPLVITRIFRACQNVILTSISVYLCADELLWKKEEKASARNLVTVIVFWILQLMFADSIYTPAAFGLYRAYEAKAFTANVLVSFALYLSIKVIQERRNLWLVVLFLWGCLAISTSAMIVCGAECALFIVTLWIYNRFFRKQERIHVS